MHRIGRTGRAGASGRATSLFTDRDSFIVSQIRAALAAAEKGDANAFSVASGKAARAREREQRATESMVEKASRKKADAANEFASGGGREGNQTKRGRGGGLDQQSQREGKRNRNGRSVDGLMDCTAYLCPCPGAIQGKYRHMMRSFSQASLQSEDSGGNGADESAGGGGGGGGGGGVADDAWDD